MVTVVLAEEAEEVAEESDIDQVQEVHWSCCTPFAGVKYYAYVDRLPPPREKDISTLDGVPSGPR